MMTTSKAFGSSNITDWVHGPSTSAPAPVVNEKQKKLNEAIDQFLKGEITAEQLEIVKKTLE